MHVLMKWLLLGGVIQELGKLRSSGAGDAVEAEGSCGDAIGGPDGVGGDEGS